MMNRPGRMAAACGVLVVALAGCGGFEPRIAEGLSILNVRVRPAGATGVRVTWQTSEAATSRLDYRPLPQPPESPTTTFYTMNETGVGRDCDDHIYSESRTNCETVGPEVNTVVDFALRHDHDLVAARVTSTTTFSLAVISETASYERALFTVTLPKGSSLLDVTGTTVVPR